MLHVQFDIYYISYRGFACGNMSHKTFKADMQGNSFLVLMHMKTGIGLL